MQRKESLLHESIIYPLSNIIRYREAKISRLAVLFQASKPLNLVINLETRKFLFNFQCRASIIEPPAPPPPTPLPDHFATVFNASGIRGGLKVTPASISRT